MTAQSIYIDRTSAPTYAGSKVISFLEERFVVLDKNGETPINIDGVKIPCLPISDFGFTLEDFSTVPINHYGLKEVAVVDTGHSLIVTKSGYFVIYHNLVPSLPGLPCAIGLVTGPWVSSNGSLNLYPVSVWTKVELLTITFAMMQHSFREFPSFTIDVINSYDGCTSSERYQRKGNLYLFSGVEFEEHESKFLDLYPKCYQDTYDLHWKHQFKNPYISEHMQILPTLQFGLDEVELLTLY